MPTKERLIELILQKCQQDPKPPGFSEAVTVKAIKHVESLDSTQLEALRKRLQQCSQFLWPRLVLVAAKATATTEQRGISHQPMNTKRI